MPIFISISIMSLNVYYATLLISRQIVLFHDLCYDKGDIIMMGNTHGACGALIGLGVSAAAAPFMPATSSLMTIGFTLTSMMIGNLAGRIPDIDEPGSTVSRYLWFIAIPIQLFRLLIAVVGYFLLPKKVRKKILKDTGHRYLTHTLFMLCLIWISLIIGSLYLKEIIPPTSMFFIYAWMIIFFLGMCSHIVLDMISGTVPLLSPFNEKRYGAAERITIDGFREAIIRMAMNLSSLSILYMMYIHH